MKHEREENELTEDEILARTEAVREVLGFDTGAKINLNDERNAFVVGAAAVVWTAAKKFYENRAASAPLIKSDNTQVIANLEREIERLRGENSQLVEWLKNELDGVDSTFDLSHDFVGRLKAILPEPAADGGAGSGEGR